jgi:hypothetical protein
MSTETIQQNVNITPTSIHSRAMLVSLRLSAWTARKYDKKITQETNSAHGAVADAGRYNKMLLPGDCASYKALNQLIGNTRTEHYQNTLAWSDEGWRLLPTANYQEYSGFTRKRKAEFTTLLDEFLQEYPTLRDSAKIRLNGMYKEEDYPTISQIRNKFGFYLDFSPLPAQGDFRVDLPSEDIRRIESAMQDRVALATSDAMKDAWQRLQDCVKHIHDRMSTPDAIFRDSLIYNARELCDVLGRLNVTGDTQLEAFRAEVEESLAANDPDTLRENDSLREDTAVLADDILTRMSAFYNPEVTQ